MTIQKMGHLCLRVKDLEASQQFYEQVFGFQETARKDYPDHQFTLVYLSLPDDGFEIELTYNYGHGAYTVGDGFSHMAVVSDDVEKEHAKHSRLGYPITKLSGLPGSPYRYYFVTDPDGYRVEVVQAR